MAEVVLKPDPQHFPPATAVKVFAFKRPATPLTTGKPAGSQLSEPTVAANGSLTVTGLTAGEAYVGWFQSGGVDAYLFFEAEPPAAGGAGGLNQAEIETLLGTTGVAHLLLEGTGVELLKLRSTSTTAHAASIVQAGKSGATSSALNVASENPASSALQVSGVETGRGSVKVSHTNSTAEAAGDENASLLSLERHGNAAEKKTAAQGIALSDNETDTTGGSTGAWLSIRDRTKALLLRVRAAGTLEFPNKAAVIATPASAGDLHLDNEGGHLRIVNKSGIKYQLDELIGLWRALEALAKVTGAVATFEAAEARAEAQLPGSGVGFPALARLKGVLKVSEEVKPGERIFTLPVGLRPPGNVILEVPAFAEGTETVAAAHLKIVASTGEVVSFGSTLTVGKIIVLDGQSWGFT